MVRFPSRPLALRPYSVAAALLAAIGCLALPALPSLGWAVAAVLLGSLLLALGRAPALALAALIAGWTLLQMQAAVDRRLPTAGDWTISVRIEGLPDCAQSQCRFDARLAAASADLPLAAGSRLRLAWYAPVPPLAAGQHWQLPVRLRPPRGSVNPAGFDLERHAAQRGWVATGYVRQPERVQLEADSPGVVDRIDRWRQRIADWIDADPERTARRFLRGLAVGDTRGLDDRDWDLLRASGLSHLLAISGLHIGLVAGFGALLIRLPYRLWPRLGERWPRPQAAALAALLAAAAYSALAGFGLPTVRTLAMLAAVLLAVLLRRRLDAWQALALAALVLLLADPLALLGAGFWLSFVGVWWLLLCLPQGRQQRFWGELLRAQWVLAIGLLPLGVLFFGQASLLGAGLNLLAVPWVTLLVVPLTLLALLAAPLAPLAEGLLGCADAAMQALWWLVERTASWPGAEWFLPAPSPWVFVLAVVGALCLLAPRGLPGRWFGPLLLLPLLRPALPELVPGELRVRVFDVGQGLAVLLSTRQHHLLYDSGAAFRGGSDSGETVLIPSLRALGVGRLDQIMISHADSDHAGGLSSLRALFPEVPVRSGEPGKLAAEACQSGQSWNWDGVQFRLLHPPPHFPELGNDASCVMLIEAAGRRLLLPGDIGGLIETRLLRQHPELAADLLLVPHHGSRSSSSAAFVDALQPALAVVSAGHDNRFGHPAAEVIARYRGQGSELLSTAEHGSLQIDLDRAGTLSWQRSRQDSPRWWRQR